MKYVTFQTIHGGTTRINRANIVGFSVSDPRVVWTDVILDSGAIVPLNGVSLYDAEETLKEFDKRLADKIRE